MSSPLLQPEGTDAGKGKMKALVCRQLGNPVTKLGSDRNPLQLSLNHPRPAQVLAPNAVSCSSMLTLFFWGL